MNICTSNDFDITKIVSKIARGIVRQIKIVIKSFLWRPSTTSHALYPAPPAGVTSALKRSRNLYFSIAGARSQNDRETMVRISPYCVVGVSNFFILDHSLTSPENKMTYYTLVEVVRVLKLIDN